MAKGDRAFIYHSGDEKALVGLARIVSDPYPDPKAGDPKLAVVDIEAGDRLPRPVTLAAVKADPAFADLGSGPHVPAQRHTCASRAVEASPGHGRRPVTTVTAGDGCTSAHLMIA